MSCALMMSRRRSSKERSPPLASGMEPLHQGLVLRLDGRRRRRSRRGRGRRAPGGRRPCSGAASAPAASRRRPGREILAVEDPERVAIAPFPRRRLGPARLGASAGGVDAHGPGRAVADDRILLVGRHGGVRHAGEIIVRGVVFAHVVEAEAPISAPPGRGPSAPGIRPAAAQPGCSQTGSAARSRAARRIAA